MRELISFTIGKESNHASTHFWNFQEEQLLYNSNQAKDDKTGASDSSVVLFYEKQSGKMDPRVVFVDYRDNFGNFSSCFALEKQAEQAKPDVMWAGPVQVSEQEQLPLSTFHQQLLDYEQYAYGQEEETKTEPEPEQIDYHAAKQAGMSTKQMFEQYYTNQIEKLEQKEEQIDTSK